jgi:hypothetical protein
MKIQGVSEIETPILPHAAFIRGRYSHESIRSPGTLPWKELLLCADCPVGGSMLPMLDLRWYLARTVRLTSEGFEKLLLLFYAENIKKG